MTPDDPITGRRVEPMDAEKKARLAAKGYWVGDAEDFLGLSKAERVLVDFRLGLSRRIKEARERQGMSQATLALAMKTSQSRLSRIEAGYPDVTIDLMLRALVVAGGEVPRMRARPRQPKAAKPDAAPRPKAIPNVKAGSKTPAASPGKKKTPV
jgi:DNA-binding XRE family transcriptional regulator